MSSLPTQFFYPMCFSRRTVFTPLFFSIQLTFLLFSLQIILIFRVETFK